MIQTQVTMDHKSKTKFKEVGIVASSAIAFSSRSRAKVNMRQSQSKSNGLGHKSSKKRRMQQASTSSLIEPEASPMYLRSQSSQSSQSIHTVESATGRKAKVGRDRSVALFEGSDCYTDLEELNYSRIMEHFQCLKLEANKICYE